MEDTNWRGKITVFRKEQLNNLVQSKKITTKVCPICSNNNLLLYATLNLKTCTDCSIDINWYKAKGETNYI